MRLGITISSASGSSRQRAVAAASSTCACGNRRGSKCSCSERMPGVRSSMPGMARARSVPSSACTWKRSSRSSTGAPNSTSRLSSPHWRMQIVCVAARWRAVLQAPKGWRARPILDGHEAHAIAGPQLAHLPEVVEADGHRADEAAEAGAIRPQDHRHVASEVDSAHRIGVVMDGDDRRVPQNSRPRFRALVKRPPPASRMSNPPRDCEQSHPGL